MSYFDICRKYRFYVHDQVIRLSAEAVKVVSFDTHVQVIPKISIPLRKRKVTGLKSPQISSNDK